MSLQIAYYADDFTGSTDALEFLARSGLSAALFLEPPGPDQLKAHGDLDAIGVAGCARSLGADAIDAILRRDFALLKALGPRHVHYKVCSTFDSSPKIGSIGKAIDVGSEVFDSGMVPLLVAAPALGRYCAFGNLFARMGIGSQGAIHRLDRHPSMRCHPTTPADEADLRLHLAKQTSKRIGLFDLLALGTSLESRQRRWRELEMEGNGVVLFDALYSEHLDAIGALLEAAAVGSTPYFSVGSSGIDMALGQAWAEQGVIQPLQEFAPAGPSGPLLVVSGSCSPVTGAQIAWGLGQGFADVAIFADRLAETSAREQERERVTALAVAALRDGRSVIAHTAIGSDDARVAKARQALTGMDTASALGSFLGELARTCIEATGLRRLIVAGGDSSSYAARALGIQSVEMIAPMAPGAPLCRARAPGSPADGLEVNFKGGQVGTDDYFGLVASGERQ